MLSQDEVDIVVGVLKVGKEGGREGGRRDREFRSLILVVEHQASTPPHPLLPSFPPSLNNQIASKTVADCMVAMDKVFCLSTQDELDGPMLVRTNATDEAGREGVREDGKEGGHSNFQTYLDTFFIPHLSPSLPPSLPPPPLGHDHVQWLLSHPRL